MTLTNIPAYVYIYIYVHEWPLPHPSPEQSSFERSWGQLAALYPHDSLPEVAENTIIYGAFNVSYTCMLHLQYALDDLSQYIGASRDCSLIHVLLLFVAALRVLGEPPPQICLNLVMLLLT